VFDCSSLVITSRYSEDEVCRCLKLGILKLISRALSGVEDRRLADSILIDEIYRVIGRLRKGNSRAVIVPSLPSKNHT